MARFLQSKKESIGVSPYDLLFRGEKKTDQTRIRLIQYNADIIEEQEFDSIELAEASVRKDAVSWINIDGLHDTCVMQGIASLFDIDTLILANVLDTHNRPKMHEYDNCIFISTKMLRLNDDGETVSSENLALLFKDNVLLSFQEREGDVFDPVRERLRKNRKRIRCSGSDYLVFALLDIVIDNYIHIISRLGDKIEDIDDELASPATQSLEQINKYKGELTYLNKTIKPCREMILNLAKLDSDYLDDAMDIHFHELQNNIELAYDSVLSYREMLSDQLNIFHSTVAYHLNGILKLLTMFSVIFIPITFIAGVYGTNFDNIPELHYRYGYYVMWGAIVAAVAIMLWYFNKKRWL